MLDHATLMDAGVDGLSDSINRLKRLQQLVMLRIVQVPVSAHAEQLQELLIAKKVEGPPVGF